MKGRASWLMVVKTGFRHRLSRSRLKSPMQQASVHAEEDAEDALPPFPSFSLQGVVPSRCPAFTAMSACARVRPSPLIMRRTAPGRAAYNGGSPAKWRQNAVCVTPDGHIPSATVQAANAIHLARTVLRFLAYMTTLHNWPTFGRGWAVRISDNMLRGAM
ncbi:hypothetical protein [Chromobacterium violaceum]|nr:hypothetical protein [Chromobacterium violaceum]